MTPRTLRLLSGGATPSNTTEVRLRFIESTATLVKHWAVAGTDKPDLAHSDFVLLIRKYSSLSDGDSPRGGVSNPTKVL